MLIKKVVLGISGGVDSAVAGLLLKRKGYDVKGVFMRNWDEKDETGACSVDREAEDAEWVCKKLDIPFSIVDFTQEYWNEVFSYLLEEYQLARTPNPDIYCNRFVKFKHFLNFAREQVGAAAIATGHYAKTSFGNMLENYKESANVKLLQAVDQAKDQTFFLSQVPQEALKLTLFPLGDLTKDVVKKIAKENGLIDVALKEESRGICFIGKRNFSSFISQYVNDSPGAFVDIDSGDVLGQHRGLHHWTIGQRAKLFGYPWKYFVCDKDLATNSIYVGKGGNHFSLFSDSLIVGPFKWVSGPPGELEVNTQKKYHFRFQHGKPLVKCSLIDCFVKESPLHHPRYSSMTSSLRGVTNGIFIKLDQPLRALTPGQFAVIYDGQECLGSATIECVGPSMHSRLKRLKDNQKLFDHL